MIVDLIKKIKESLDYLIISGESLVASHGCELCYMKHTKRWENEISNGRKRRESRNSTKASKNKKHCYENDDDNEYICTTWIPNNSLRLLFNNDIAYTDNYLDICINITGDEFEKDDY